MHAHDAHALAAAAVAVALAGRGWPRLAASRRVDFHVRRNPLSVGSTGRWTVSSARPTQFAAMLIDDGVPPERTAVVYEGVDVDRIAELPALDVRRELGLPEDAPVVGNVAALVPHKGQRDLVDAAARVVAEVPEARFVIVGAGELHDSLVAQVARLGLERHVVLTGFRTDALALLKGFDLFVMSSGDRGPGNLGARCDGLRARGRRDPRRRDSGERRRRRDRPPRAGARPCRARVGRRAAPSATPPVARSSPAPGWRGRAPASAPRGWSPKPPPRTPH